MSPADPTCTICRIVTGELSAQIILDEPHAVAFLDHRPLFPGHTLVVPRDHVATLPDLPDDDLAPYFSTVQRLATVIPATLDAAGTFVAANNVVSQSVPHLHFHVVPRRPKDGLRGFFWPRTRYETPEEMAAVADRLRRALQC
ncbi:MAG TPA: HIT family protein [Acidimicrobiia bacterium]|nr:HIT family protein [Acidimicrobiia bacterium]